MAKRSVTPPGGFYARLRPTRKGALEVFASEHTADALLLNHPSLVALQQRGVSANDLSGIDISRPLVAASIAPDEYLYDLSLENELEPVLDVAPHWYLPFDVPTYKDGDMDPEQRQRNLDDYIFGVHRAVEVLREAESRTRVLPLLKGVYPEELRRCYELISSIADGYVGVYVGQFFGPSVGNRINHCREWLRTIDAVCDPAGIVLIGLSSPNYLRGLPQSVVAAAGRHTWLRESEYLSLPIAESQSRITRLCTDVRESLETGYNQLSLRQFTHKGIHG